MFGLGGAEGDGFTIAFGIHDDAGAGRNVYRSIIIISVDGHNGGAVVVHLVERLVDVGHIGERVAHQVPAWAEGDRLCGSFVERTYEDQLRSLFSGVEVALAVHQNVKGIGGILIVLVVVLPHGVARIEAIEVVIV